MKKKKEATRRVGSELLHRLEKFTKKIETLEGPADLPEVLTVRKVKLDLRPRPFNAAEVRAIRDRLRVSQGVFAEFLGVSTSTVQDWEQGVSPPRGPVCRIMEEMLRDPVQWHRRIRELSAVTAD